MVQIKGWPKETCRLESVSQRPSWTWCPLRTWRASLIFACRASGDSRRWRSSPLSISRSIPEAATMKGVNFYLFIWVMRKNRKKKHVAYDRANRRSPDSTDAVAHAAHELKYSRHLQDKVDSEKTGYSYCKSWASTFYPWHETPIFPSPVKSDYTKLNTFKTDARVNQLSNICYDTNEFLSSSPVILPASCRCPS